jgi:alkylation response protein AidB-like acyl-CoA dehydrogenase
MNSLPRPELIIKQKQVDIIRDSVAKAEKEGKITKAQLNVIHEQKWFKMLIPSAPGGLQTPIPDALKLIENIAIADGSVGWMVAHTALAGWLSGFVNAAAAKELFSGDKIGIAGSSATGGTAEKTKSGYTVSGLWPQAAGSGDATAFTGVCVVTQNGAPVKDETNKPLILGCLFLKSEVFILQTWSAMGLVATAANDFEVKNLKIPETRTFKINADSAVVNARLYQFPLLQLTEAALAASISGMAFHFIDCYENLIADLKSDSGTSLNDDIMVQDIFEKQTLKFSDARTKLFYAVELAWQACVNQQQIKDTILYKVSAAAQDLTKKARECVDALYPLCGMQAVDKNSEINRVWRDLHTASHESLLVFGAV